MASQNAHTLGKAAQRLTLVELKNICEGGKAFVAERGIEPLIKGLELADGCARVAAQIVRDAGDAGLHGRVFKYRLAANEHFAGIRAVHACDMADDRRFARAVGADQTVNRARRDGHRQAVQRREPIKALGEIFDFNHASSSFASSCASSSSLVAPSTIASRARERICARSSCFFCACRGLDSAANEPLPGTLMR